MTNDNGYYRHDQSEEELRHAYKQYRHQRRTKIFYWLWGATLIILPFTFVAYMQYDEYAHSLEHQGCKVINVFEGGAKVYECPRGIK